MSPHNLANMYPWLSAEERFRLILTASSRGDFAERDRLSDTSKSLALKTRDFVPWAQAFTEVAMMNFMVFLEEAAQYLESRDLWDHVYSQLQQARDQAETSDPTDAEAESEDASELPELSEDEKCENLLFDMYLAAGFILKTKIDGWKLFCERRNVPALTIWEVLPGYERFARILNRIEGTKTRPGAAFLAGGMMRFLRDNRPAGQPEPTLEGLISAEKVANELDEMFRDTVKRHGG